jgi:hypothetical protein
MMLVKGSKLPVRMVRLPRDDESAQEWARMYARTLRPEPRRRCHPVLTVCGIVEIAVGSVVLAAWIFGG